MAVLDQTRVLSTPKVMVDGRIIKILPNSCSMTFGGENKVRTVSSGGGSVDLVSGLNAEELLSHVKFDVATTAEMADWARTVKDNANKGIPVTIRIVEDTAQFAFTKMFCTKALELGLEADGKIPMEFSGLYQP